MFVCLAGALFPAAWPVLAKDSTQDLPQARPFIADEFRVPEAVGHISEVVAARIPAANRPSVVLIQDAHVNYEAQKNIANILEQLVRDHGMNLVLVEGGEGDVSLPKMRRLSLSISKDRRVESADWSLRQGLMAGHEYFYMVSDAPLTLWGIDSQELYQQNFYAFLELDEQRRQLGPKIKVLKTMIDAAGAEHLSTPLREFRLRAIGFADGSLSLTGYAQAIAEALERKGEPLDAFPHLSRLRQTDAAQRTIDLAAVSSEQRVAVDELRRSASADELQNLGSLAKGMREGAGSEPFYLELKRLMEAHTQALSTLPALSRYLDMLSVRSRIQAKALWQELDAASRKAQELMCASDEERRFLDMAEAVVLYEKLLSMKWVPADYARWNFHKERYSISRFYAELEQAAVAAGSGESLGLDAKSLEAKLDQAAIFYAVAFERNNVMAKHILEKMRSDNSFLAVLIVGGFHTDELARLLVENGASVVVATPVVGSGKGDDRLYRSLLKAQAQPFSELDKQLSHLWTSDTEKSDSGNNPVTAE